MQEQPSNSKNDDEPERPEHIPDYFLWYPDMGTWDAPPSDEPGWDVEAWLREFKETMAEIRRERQAEIAAGRDPGPWLISVDQLRAAGVFDVPPAMRKSLSDGEERDLFSDLPGDDHTPPQEQPPRPKKPKRKKSADKLP